MIKEKKMFKDTPKGLLEAVLAVNKGTREKYIEEQRRKTRMTGREGRADPAAHKDAHKMADELSGNQYRLDVAEPRGKLTAADFEKLRKEEKEKPSFPRVSKGEKPEPRGGAGIKLGHSYGGGRQKYKDDEDDEDDKTKNMKEAATPVRSRMVGRTKATTYRGTVRYGAKPPEDVPSNEPAPTATVKATSTTNPSAFDARFLSQVIADRKPETNEPTDAEKERMKKAGVGIRTIRGKAQSAPENERVDANIAPDGYVPKLDRTGKKALAGRSRGRGLYTSYQYESKDTPGNGYTHQCALHVKSEQYGEGKTLFSQHAEPDADGNIAWYDVMFNEGIRRVRSSELEVLVSEAHGNHKMKK
jgi:hypothetical protein